MNRIAIVLDANGELQSIASDSPAQVFIVAPHCPRDRVYEYTADIGPQYVQEQIGGYAVGHAHDGTLGEGDGTGKRPPSRPKLTPIK